MIEYNIPERGTPREINPFSRKVKDLLKRHKLSKISAPILKEPPPEKKTFNFTGLPIMAKMRVLNHLPYPEVINLWKAGLREIYYSPYNSFWLGYLLYLFKSPNVSWSSHLDIPYFPIRSIGLSIIKYVYQMCFLCFTQNEIQFNYEWNIYLCQTCYAFIPRIPYEKPSDKQLQKYLADIRTLSHQKRMMRRLLKGKKIPEYPTDEQLYAVLPVRILASEPEPEPEPKLSKRSKKPKRHSKGKSKKHRNKC